MDIKDTYAIAAIGYTPQGRVLERMAISFYLEAMVGVPGDERERFVHLSTL